MKQRNLKLEKKRKPQNFGGYRFASAESSKFFLGRNSVFFVCVEAVDQGNVGFLRIRWLEFL
jgi:hypothetical protein